MSAAHARRRGPRRQCGTYWTRTLAEHRHHDGKKLRLRLRERKRECVYAREAEGGVMAVSRRDDPRLIIVIRRRDR